MDRTAVAKRVAEARRARGMTQEELAAKADVSPTHISVLERGVKLPNLDTFIAIANALEVSADYLLQDVVTGVKRVRATSSPPESWNSPMRQEKD